MCTYQIDDHASVYKSACACALLCLCAHVHVCVSVTAIKRCVGVSTKYVHMREIHARVCVCVCVRGRAKCVCKCVRPCMRETESIRTRAIARCAYVCVSMYVRSRQIDLSLSVCVFLSWLGTRALAIRTCVSALGRASLCARTLPCVCGTLRRLSLSLSPSLCVFVYVCVCD
jgi:hypothetical protein